MKRNIDNWTKEEETFLRENYRKDAFIYSEEDEGYPPEECLI